jgi:hypothetical protein
LARRQFVFALLLDAQRRADRPDSGGQNRNVERASEIRYARRERALVGSQT